MRGQDRMLVVLLRGLATLFLALADLIELLGDPTFKQVACALCIYFAYRYTFGNYAIVWQ